MAKVTKKELEMSKAEALGLHLEQEFGFGWELG